MGEPQRVGWSGNVGEEHAEQDRLLAKIEGERLISGWCWSPMTDTLARMRELPESVAWVGTRYLQAIVAMGDRVFGSPEHYQMSMLEAEARQGIPCRCGKMADADRTTRPGGPRGRDVTVAVCPSCGITQAMYDGEPYPHRTLLAQGFT